MVTLNPAKFLDNMQDCGSKLGRDAPSYYFRPRSAFMILDKLSLFTLAATVFGSSRPIARLLQSDAAEALVYGLRLRRYCGDPTISLMIC